MSVESVTIVTAVYQDVRLARAIDSVLAQKVDCQVEHVVVSDETSEALDAVLQEYADRITVIKNDTRGGMYRARNQGIAVAKGDVIGFLNADDRYYDDMVLADAVRVFREREELELLSGDCEIINRSGEVVYFKYRVRDLARHGWVRDGMPFTDYALFHRRSVFERFGEYDDSFRITGDIDLMLRMSRAGVSHLHLDRYFTVCPEAELSSWGDPRNALKLYFEMARSHHRNGMRRSVAGFYLFSLMVSYMVWKYTALDTNHRFVKPIKQLVKGLIQNMSGANKGG